MDQAHCLMVSLSGRRIPFIRCFYSTFVDMISLPKDHVKVRNSPLRTTSAQRPQSRNVREYDNPFVGIHAYVHVQNSSEHMFVFLAADILDAPM
jgi:hypothetical protein